MVVDRGPDLSHVLLVLDSSIVGVKLHSMTHGLYLVVGRSRDRQRPRIHLYSSTAAPQTTVQNGGGPTSSTRGWPLSWVSRRCRLRWRSARRRACLFAARVRWRGLVSGGLIRRGGGSPVAGGVKRSRRSPGKVSSNVSASPGMTKPSGVMYSVTNRPVAGSRYWSSTQSPKVLVMCPYRHLVLRFS